MTLITAEFSYFSRKNNEQMFPWRLASTWSEWEIDENEKCESW